LTFESARRSTVVGVDTFTIGEVAERTGFPASTLRYYEIIGLVAPSARTAAGYRLYDGRALARLAFVGRAKHLGCTLDEITDLVGLWDGSGSCDPVQRRLHELVTDKLAATRRQLAELTELSVQLEEAAAHLAVPAADGPCDGNCACMTLSAPANRRRRLPVSA
jgi:DNA-binding transcriptional MerR regulator